MVGDLSNIMHIEAGRLCFLWWEKGAGCMCASLWSLQNCRKIMLLIVDGGSLLDACIWSFIYLFLILISLLNLRTGQNDPQACTSVGTPPLPVSALESSVHYICLNSVARQQSGELPFKLSYYTIEVVPNICSLSLINAHLCWFRTYTSQTFHNKKECYHICSFNLACCHHYTTLDCTFK